ncbi:hypothetical protein VTI74DRAFT_10593 [Chaetomium olivicolor]
MDKGQIDEPEHAASLAGCPQPPSVSGPLTPIQLHALLDILTHHQTYAEVESFKDPHTISQYGYPFAQRGPGSSSHTSYATESSAPLLAGVLRSIVLPFPGVRDLPPEFWHVRFQGLLEKLAAAELSESYDKGALGTRKTLATAASAIHEAVSRGILGGVANGPTRDLHGDYDRSKAEDLARAWEDAVQELVYGNLVEELFVCAAEKRSLEAHSPALQAVADYVIIHLATLVHHVFVLSPEGPYLLKLLENVHKLLPYSMVRQTLRIGNAATMLNGMMRLLLSKMGVGAVSNWIGLTQNADDGMNVLQRIIWLVLSWDALEFRKSADAIEKAKGNSTASKEQLAAIRHYLKKPRTEQEKIRNTSRQEPQSIAVTILQSSNPSLAASLAETQHQQCLEYLSALLAARDRDEIANALCRQNPDLFTQAIKDAVASFEPMIRTVHQHIDLREHVSAAESFITDFINVTKVTKSMSRLPRSASNSTLKSEATNMRAPSVEDYVDLLRRNRQLLYNWLHQIARDCPQIRNDFCSWAKEAVKVFRPPRQTPPEPATEPHLTNEKKTPTAASGKHRPGAAGALSPALQSLFASLPPSTQSAMLPAIDAHAAYLSALEDLSLARMQRILDSMHTTTTPNTTSAPTTTAPPHPSSPLISTWSPSGRSFSGPGMYLSRWQDLLDSTLIGPAAPGGPLRKGADVKGVVARGKVGSGSGHVSVTGAGNGNGVGNGSGRELGDPALLDGVVGGEEPSRADVRVVVESLGEGFRKLVGELVTGGRM